MISPAELIVDLFAGGGGASRELQAAQGFPAAYDMTDGGRLSKTALVRLIGNSVYPPMAAAVIRANLGTLAVGKAAA